MDMSVVYSCHLAGCTIECPCHICQVPSVCCKSRHKSELCKMCDSQCQSHQITVPYMFDASTNLYTIITEKMGEYRHAVGYAGIPNSCKHCSADVLEHQVLHLSHHQLCRYCRYESRPLDQFEGSKSLKNFRKSEKMLTWRDNLTCSVCLLEFKDKFARKQHEAVIHRQEVQKFKCGLCTKSYASKFSLEYHAKSHEGPTEKPTCELCGKCSQLYDIFPVIRRLSTKPMFLLQKYLVAVGVKFNIHWNLTLIDMYVNSIVIKGWTLTFMRGWILWKCMNVTNVINNLREKRTWIDIMQLLTVKTKKLMIVFIVTALSIGGIVWRGI